MMRTIAVVLVGLFRSWEFLFIAGALVVLMPFVFSLASREPARSRPGKKAARKKEARVEASETEPVG